MFCCRGPRTWGGGLALFWKTEGGVNIRDSCSNFIDFECIHESMEKWRYTGFYGFPERRRRVESWNLIRNLSTVSRLPWCIIGDFNDMSSMEEKRGGNRQPRALLTGFSETILECGLEDLGFRGDIFTWERARGTERWVQERLDRGLSMKKWREMFPAAEVHIHEVSTSDHLPLFLQLNRQVYPQK